MTKEMIQAPPAKDNWKSIGELARKVTEESKNEHQNNG